jgi:DNA-binding CsgD family transcriptional regulator
LKGDVGRIGPRGSIGKIETVKTHMKSILARLAASDRTHAVTIATKRGILGR